MAWIRFTSSLTITDFDSILKLRSDSSNYSKNNSTEASSYRGQRLKWDTVIEQKAVELSRFLKGRTSTVDFEKPSPNLERFNDRELRERIKSLTSDEARKLRRWKKQRCTTYAESTQREIVQYTGKLERNFTSSLNTMITVRGMGVRVLQFTISITPRMSRFISSRSFAHLYYRLTTYDKCFLPTHSD